MGLEITGEGTAIAGNGGAGLCVVDGMSTRVEGGALGGTLLRPRVEGETGRIDVGDGIQTIGDASMIRLAQLRLEGNERVGVLFELSGGALEGEITGVMVDGTGDALGAIAQNGTIPEGWDSGITRSGAVLANDAAWTGTLDHIQSRVAIPPADLTGVDGRAGGTGRAGLGCGSRGRRRARWRSRRATAGPRCQQATRERMRVRSTAGC
jgi:hypothetical protein